MSVHAAPDACGYHLMLAGDTAASDLGLTMLLAQKNSYAALSGLLIWKTSKTLTLLYRTLLVLSAGSVAVVLPYGEPVEAPCQ